MFRRPTAGARASAPRPREAPIPAEPAPPAVDLPDTLNVAERFLDRRVAEGLGGRRALVTDARTWSYAEVRDAAHRYGNVFRELGVEPEQRVVVSLPDGPDFVAALFGALEIGAVGVMVNPDLPAEELRWFFDYTRAKVAVIGIEGAARFEAARSGAGRPPHLHVVGEPAHDRRLHDASPALDPFPTHRDDAALWLFSGGTTGRPKGVVQTHGSFANTTELYGRGVLGIGPDDLTVSVPKLYFGYATGSNLFFPFSAGGAAVLFPERCTCDALFGQIERHRPTVLVNVPTMVGKMVADPSAPDRDLGSLRLATSAGEALPPELHRRWNETFGVELLDGLGTAEMWHVFISNRPGEVAPGTLGRAVPGFEVRLRDDEGRDVPDGEPGRLWVRGDSLAKGYWQHPERTRDAFRGAWYVSGDMLRKDDEGRFVYCGRSDDMLKVSGKWMSPSELENCLLEHPAVSEAAVVGAEDADGLVKPCAFVVRESTEDAGSSEEELADALRDWAKERLQPYKYPRKVVFVETLPRTHLGKVDRGRLAAEAAG